MNIVKRPMENVIRERDNALLNQMCAQRYGHLYADVMGRPIPMNARLV
jgi:hypothetical protein